MEDDQQFCLRWNNHQSTLIQNFDTLLESGTLVDCTLAAEGKYLKAHKVVLSACSPYFEGLLSEHYDKHPVFILKDVKFKELKAMMDYMYRGEVNISQDQLSALLKAAESLQIKGLSDSRTGAGGGATTGKADTRPLKTASSTTASSSVDIPHGSSGLTIEKNSKVPRQSLQQVSVSDLPEDSASPQLRGFSSREGSQSPTRKKKRSRKRSLGNDDNNSMENHEASNSSDVNISAPALGVAPVAEEKSHADPADSIGRSALMQQLTKPADEMLQIPIEKPEPSEEMIQPKSEYLDDQESVEDLTNLDDDMNDLNEMEQDNSRAGPSHDPSQHPGLASWHIAGDRSNASVVGAAAGPPGSQDEVFLAAHEAAQAQRDSQDGGADGYVFTSVSEADLNKLKITSPRKKTLNVINPTNRFYADAINPEIIIENSPNTSSNIGESRSHEILMANLSNSDGNPEVFSHNAYNQGWSLMNVRAWVEMYDRKQLRMSPLTNVLDSGVVEPGDRRELVRIAVAGMVEFNEGNLYPSCQLKTQLAKDIITAFPKLRSANGGYEHFYDPKTNRGFIEFRLKTLRLKLNPSEKKRATSSQMRERKTNKLPLKVVINEELLDDGEFNSKISELFLKMPTEANKMEIFRLTEETRANRQKQIRTAVESMTLATIFNIYPRFKDFEGELIKREFLAEYPHNDTFLDRFAAYYTPRILQYCSSTKPHLLQTIQDISDNNLKALILLPELLPSPNYTKRKENKTEPKTLLKVKPTKTIPNENLLQFVNISDESLLNEIYAHRKSPFLLCCMANHERKGNFYIKTEGHLIQVGANAIIAFDVLLKLHYCFDVPFASDLVYFYDFITGCILQLNEPKGCCVALNSSLSNVTLTNIDSSNMFMFTQ